MKRKTGNPDRILPGTGRGQSHWQDHRSGDRQRLRVFSATFYRHFKDKYDLIAWDYAQKAAEIMERLNEKDYLWGQVLLDWAAYFQQEKEYLMNLLLHTSGHDAFIRYMTEIHTDAFTNYLQSRSGRNELDEKTSMSMAAFVS